MLLSLHHTCPTGQPVRGYARAYPVSQPNARSVVLITPSDRGYCAGAAAAALGAGAQKLITQNKNPFGTQRRCLASRQSFCALGAVRLNLNFCASVRSVATMCACSAAEQQRYSIWAHKSVCVCMCLFISACAHEFHFSRKYTRAELYIGNEVVAVAYIYVGCVCCATNCTYPYSRTHTRARA